MTKEERQAARERCEKATPGPWTGDRFDGTVKYFVLGAGQLGRITDYDAPGDCVLSVNHRTDGFPREEDAEFVLASRTDLPAALDALDSAEALASEHQAYIYEVEAKLQDVEMIARQLAERRDAAEARIAELERIQGTIESSTYGNLVSKSTKLAELIDSHEWDNMPVHKQRDWAIENAQERIEKFIGAVQCANATAKRRGELIDQLSADAMIAHRWFEKHFGEVMNGRDFATKTAEADVRIAELAHFEQRWAEAVREAAERDAENARLRAALERIQSATATIGIEFGDSEVNRIAREALKGGA